MNYADFLSVNSETGQLTWLVSRGRSKPGKPAGKRHKVTGYLRLTIDGKELQAHRVVWEMLNGPIPDGLCVDHINGDKADNRICNLRLVTTSENLQNRKGAAAHSRSGLIGVKQRGSVYEAAIVVDGRYVHLGTFASPACAQFAYIEAKGRLHIAGDALDYSRIARRLVELERRAAA